jgi:hypothetical protein
MPVTIQPFVCGFQVVMKVYKHRVTVVSPPMNCVWVVLRPFLSLSVVDTAVIGVVSAVILDH